MRRPYYGHNLIMFRGCVVIVVWNAYWNTEIKITRNPPDSRSLRNQQRQRNNFGKRFWCAYIFGIAAIGAIAAAKIKYTRGRRWVANDRQCYTYYYNVAMPTIGCSESHTTIATTNLADNILGEKYEAFYFYTLRVLLFFFFIYITFTGQFAFHRDSSCPKTIVSRTFRCAFRRPTS